MTPEQDEARTERVAIMTIDGGLTEEQAQAYCDTRPGHYGIREREEKQDGLF